MAQSQVKHEPLNTMLALEKLIAETHDDFDVYSSVVVGFDDAKNLVVELERSDSNRPRHNRKNRAVVNAEEALLLAKRLNRRLVELPQALSEEFVDTEYDFLTPDDIQTVFREMLDYILELGGHYVIDR